MSPPITQPDVFPDPIEVKNRRMLFDSPMNLDIPDTFAIEQRVSGPVFGPYILLRTLGEGEFAKVKLGIHSETGQEVAVKLIKRALVATETRLIKIKREVNVLSSLDHPNIVRLFEVIETDKYIGIIIEYASGGELFDHILAHRYLKEREACRLFAQLISGVSYMHEKNVVHRDLKLENLLLDRNRNIIITDFGFANQFSSPTNDLMATSCGSPCYAAPELVVSEGMYVGTAVDIWSCGVILYAMLCGYLPFDDDPENPDGDNINLLYKYILSTPLVFPDYVSPDARDLLRRMLVPDPTQRCDMKTIMEHNWLAPYAHIFEEGKSKSKSKNKGGSEGAEQANAEPDSPTFAETARPPKRHTIQVEYDQSRTPNLLGPQPQENHLNDIIEADEDEMNDPMTVEMAFAYPSSPTRKPKGCSRVRPTTIHFSQPGAQMSIDPPSINLPYETMVKNCSFEPEPVPSGLAKSDIAVMHPNPQSSSQQAVSSNAARKVMDWFRKKSLGRQQQAFESHMAHPRRNNSRVSHEFRLRYHSGAIDDNAVTSKSPVELMQEIKMLLEELGIEIKKEYEWKLKCVRRKRTCTSSLKSRNSVISNETHSTCSTAHSSRRRTVSAFTRLLKIGSQEPAYPINFDGPPPIEPIYGDETVDSGEEIYFVMEICKLKELGKLYIVDITRRKGNLWSYKFIYHTILDRLNLKNDRFMEHQNSEHNTFTNINTSYHHVIL
ncbi:Pkinase-domain-containing protein [Basidiobolus meristosporus CBS 931.73]|uniref:non-specific serine/threonine protein kinase n=1 Tax=Basidiobolus meristosporus CBS 931.73 TaxID=1314790 RepID=A0A1Y1XA96_9FUNG|nr:Pkinase-domain-containing protein [Basidiobolus meristosporus CBS 931.73]|eukprot:ORX82673.1 Pkinase-domain-containing protein [Basidiobolus meristosporus CBS 931.73]